MPDILKLEEFHLTDLTVKWHEEGNEGREERLIADGECALSYDVLSEEVDSRLFALKMRFQFKPKPRPAMAGYEIDANINGFFSFPEGVSELDMHSLIRINGLTILYGILRGELASVTGLFSGGRFILPAVYMPEIIASIESQREKPSRKRASKATKKKPATKS